MKKKVNIHVSYLLIARKFENFVSAQDFLKYSIPNVVKVLNQLSEC